MSGADTISNGSNGASASFNLIDEPWLLCRMTDRTLKELGIRDALLKADKIARLEGESPLTVFALHRLLLAILVAATRADKLEILEKWLKKGLDSRLLKKYLKRHAERFYLCHESHPFYQDASLRTTKPKGLDTLFYERGNSSRALIAEHTCRYEGGLPPALVARALVTAQTFFLATGKGWKRGPLTPSALALVYGKTLLQTLIYSYPLRSVETENDAPAWEWDPYPWDTTEKSYGILDLLTWQPRKILLTWSENNGSLLAADQVYVAPGRHVKSDNPSVLYQDPYRILIQKEQKQKPVPFILTERDAAWIHYPALLADVKGSGQNQKGREVQKRPILASAYELSEQRNYADAEHLRLAIYFWSKEGDGPGRPSGQGESVFPLPCPRNKKKKKKEEEEEKQELGQLLEELARLVKLVELVQRSLQDAAQAYYEELGVPTKLASETARRLAEQLPARLELAFFKDAYSSLVEGEKADEVRGRWTKIIERAARELLVDEKRSHAHLGGIEAVGGWRHVKAAACAQKTFGDKLRARYRSLVTP
jgi:CRISPR type I-E-associated protein CasA/Cse1